MNLDCISLYLPEIVEARANAKYVVETIDLFLYEN
jgi:hypothetical protein